MSDVIGQCSSCRLDVTRNQRADYLGDHIRHGNRSDCVRPLLAEIERLRTARNLAYGLLWTSKSDNKAVHRARRVLRDTMHREDQVAGIVAARAALSGGEHE